MASLLYLCEQGSQPLEIKGKTTESMERDEYFNAGGDSAQDYERLLGHRVIIYYRDAKGTSRKLVGKIVEVDGDRLWLENINPRTGKLWRGAFNCANNDISLISTVDGWGGKEDAMA